MSNVDILRIDVPSAISAYYVLLCVSAVDPEGEKDCSLGNAESGSGMRQAQARTKKEHTAVRPQRQGLRQQSTKWIYTKSRTTRSRVVITCSQVAKRMAAPKQREAYSSEHARVDFNSADATRIYLPIREARR